MVPLELDFSAIPKLHGVKNFWKWKALLVSYLKAHDLWYSGRGTELAPKEYPETKFIILATIEDEQVKAAYVDGDSFFILTDLEARFKPSK